MPLYDYQCLQCTNGFTELRRSSEVDSQIEAPKCGSLEKIRSISSFAVGESMTGTLSVSVPSQSSFR